LAELELMFEETTNGNGVDKPRVVAV
jgi:hypothetical protein